MEIEITTKDAKPLLNRTEIQARLTFEGATPTRAEAAAAVAKAAGAKKELVIVRRILTSYGTKGAKVLAYVYENAEALKKLEHGSAIKKNTFEAKKAEAPAEEKKAEEKPTEKKEEASAEEKPADTPEKKEATPAEKPAEKKEGDA